MTMDLRGGIDDQGNVLAWDYEVWTPTHNTRPRDQASMVLAGQLKDPTGRCSRSAMAAATATRRRTTPSRTIESRSTDRDTAVAPVGAAQSGWSG